MESKLMVTNAINEATRGYQTEASGEVPLSNEHNNETHKELTQKDLEDDSVSLEDEDYEYFDAIDQVQSYSMRESRFSKKRKEVDYPTLEVATNS